MVTTQEVGRTMAFQEGYRMLGTDEQQVKLFGNAVTPPAATWIVRQALASLEPSVARAA
jgi:DNA (cytosine-5)-methyltransferase 1